MAITTFIPEVWSARLLSHLDKNLVYANLVNRDYEGEIAAFGDTVHINQIGDITVKEYTKNTDIADPEQLETADQTLVIDKGDYFNFFVDDVDKAQARAELMDSAMQRASYGLADNTDKYVAAILSAGSITSGLGTTSSPISINSGNAYEYMIKVKTALDKENVPTAGRWIVVPPEFEGLMLLDNRFVAAGGAKAEERLVNGLVARAAGFDIYVSNNVPNTSNAKYKIIAGTKMACTFADQIIKTEAYRPESKFADAVKGLHVYGSKLTRANTVAVLTANFGETPVGA